MASRRRYTARHSAARRTAPVVDDRLFVAPADPWAGQPLLPRRRPPLPGWAAPTKPLPFLNKIGVR